MTGRSTMDSAWAEWHVPPAVLAAYAREDAAEADAWSAEAHLVACAGCRADLAALVDAGGLRGTVTAVRGALMTQVASAAGASAASGEAAPVVRNRARIASPGAVAGLIRPALVVRGPWIVAVVAAVLVAGVAEVVSTWSPPAWRHVPLVLLFGPLVPLAGVGLCYRATDRGWAEAVLATPAAGLRLVLWRTVAVLLIAVPITAAVAAFDHRVGPVVWLLPGLGLTAAALALGTRVELGRAAGVVAAVWAAVLVVPTIAVGHVPVPVFSAAAQGVWAVLLAVCAVVVVVRRAAFGRLPSWRPSTKDGGQ